jgi:hypothetical protein
MVRIISSGNPSFWDQVVQEYCVRALRGLRAYAPGMQRQPKVKDRTRPISQVFIAVPTRTVSWGDKCAYAEIKRSCSSRFINVA